MQRLYSIADEAAAQLIRDAVLYGKSYMNWKKDKRKDSFDLDDLRLLGDPTPAKEWVNLFFLHMFETRLERFTLRKSEGIPPIPLDDELPDGELDFNKIINRLKVMSGLDPITFKNPREGNIQMCIHGIWYTAKTTFGDSDADSNCEITISEQKP